MTADEIIQRVAKDNGIGVCDIKGKGRHRAVAWPRQQAMFEMHETGKWSLGQIGRLLGRRHYTTVLHGIRAVKRRECGL